MRFLRQFLGWCLTQRTLGAIDERECRHDGQEPWCARCAGFYNGV